MEPGTFQWCPTAGQTGTEKVPYEHQEDLLCCTSDQSLAQTSQRDCGVSFLDIFKSHLDMVLGNMFSVTLLTETYLIT